MAYLRAYFCYSFPYGQCGLLSEGETFLAFYFGLASRTFAAKPLGGQLVHGGVPYDLGRGRILSTNSFSYAMDGGGRKKW